MKKKFNYYPLLSILFLILAPALLSTLGSSTVLVNSFDYNETLIKNVGNNLTSENNAALFCFDGNKRDGYKNWDDFSYIFNNDLYGTANLVRTTTKAVGISNSTSNTTQVTFAEFQFGSQNFAGLKINAALRDFTDESIYISSIVASSLSVTVGDKLTYKVNDQDVELTIAGIYSNIDDKEYLNSTYFEFNKPVCFVSNLNFKRASNNSFNIYMRLLNNPKLLNACYRELQPILDSNNSLLTVADGFSINNFSIGDKTLKEYQSFLSLLYNSKNNTTKFVLSVVSLVVTLVCITYIAFLGVSVLVTSIKKVFEHVVLFNVLYSAFVFGFSFIAAAIIKTSFATTQYAEFTLYRSLKTPLIAITVCTIFYLGLIIVSSYLSWKKEKVKYIENRKAELVEMKTKNNKIIFVTGSLVRGGAEKVIVELANYYASLGREVDIVILLHNKVEWDLHDRINVVNLSGTTESRIKRIGYWIKNLKQYFSSNVNATIVSFLVRVNILVLLTANKDEHQIIVSERNDPRSDGRGIIVKAFVDALYQKADTIVFQTEECRKLFPKYISEKGVVISNPITIKKYASPSKFNERLFVSAGRICEQKDQITMIRAMSIVVKTFNDVILEIYGDGDLTKPLNESINKYGLQNNVFIKPNTKDINIIILNSTAYICSSLYEGMSNSLMEASYAGVPCITTPCLGTDFVKEKENGYFFEIGAYKELAEKMLYILKNKEQYNSLRKNSIKMAKETKHEDVYLEWKRCIDGE